MIPLNASLSYNKIVRSFKKQKGFTQQAWHTSIGLLLVGILLVLPLLVVSVTPVHAQPDVNNLNRQIETSSFELQGDTTSAIGPVGLTLPAQQAPATTLAVSIISSPWATVDSNKPGGPAAFVVEAVITNTGSVAATDLMVNLNYNPGSGWALLAGEDPIRTVDSLAPGAVYYAYWFAGYPHSIGVNHQYTVTAQAANASQVSTSDNFYGNPAPNNTVRTRSSLDTGNSAQVQASANIVVGVVFTVTEVYDLGQNPGDTTFSPVGNSNFNPSAYRLLSSSVRFYNDAGTQQQTFTDQLYFPTLPALAQNAEVTYNFIALLAANTSLCSYAVINFSGNPKYDTNYCTGATSIPVTGTLSISLTKQVNSLNVQQGRLLTYTLSYTNTGTKALQYAWIWDQLPANLASVVNGSISPANDPTESNASRVAWDLGTIPAGAAGTLTFSALVDGNGQDIPNGTSLVNNAFFGVSPSQLPSKPALTSTVISTVRAPAIAITKSDGQTTTQPGSPLTYNLQVVNSGAVAASNLVITDVLPSNVTLAGPTTPNFDSQNGQTLVWNSLGAIAANGGIQNISVPVTVNANVSIDGTVLTNIATIKYENGAGHVFTTKTATDTTTVQVPTTNLVFSKTATDLNGAPLAVGDTIRYTLRVTNTGSAPALNVVVTDDLPNQVTCQSVSGTTNPPAGCADPLIWTIPSLAAGSTATLNINVTLNPGTEGQSIVNTAVITGDNVPTPPPNPQVCPDGSPPVGGVCANQPGPATSLILSKTATDVNGPPLAVGDTVLYTLQLTNTGSATALNITVTDDLPSQVTCQSVSGTTNPPAGCADPLVWTIPSLAAGSTVSLTIQVILNPSSQDQSIVNTAVVTGGNVPAPPPSPQVCPDGSPPVGGVCANTPEASTTLAFNKTATDLNGAPLAVGDTIRYTLQVTNTGLATATNVIVTDDLPSQVTCQSVSGTTNPPAGCADPLVWTIPSLGGGSTASLIINVTLNQGTEGQTIINSAVVTGDNVPTPPPNPEVCPDGSLPVGGVCANTPGPATTLEFSKTAKDLNGAPLIVGDTIRYTLRVTNTGSVPALNVVVTDDLPNQVTCQSVSGATNPPAGCADPLTWTIPSLAVGGKATLNINVTLKQSSVGKSVINTASVIGGNVPMPPANSKVCPDGSLPVGAVCTNKPQLPPPAAEPPTIYLPLIKK